MTHAATLRDVRDAIRSRARSAADVCREALARIEALDGQLHAFNTVVADRAMARATAIDQEFDRWRDAPLAGVPPTASLVARQTTDRPDMVGLSLDIADTLANAPDADRTRLEGGFFKVPRVIG